MELRGPDDRVAVVYESALQHFADGIDEYAARPAAEAFPETVPAAWAETRFVSGHPGAEATVARRVRDDHAEWFLGSITAGPPADRDRGLLVPRGRHRGVDRACRARCRA